MYNNVYDGNMTRLYFLCRSEVFIKRRGNINFMYEYINI